MPSGMWCNICTNAKQSLAINSLSQWRLPARTKVTSEKSASETVLNAERFAVWVNGEWPSFVRILHTRPSSPLPLLLVGSATSRGQSHSWMRQFACANVYSIVVVFVCIGKVPHICYLQLCRVSWFSQNLIIFVSLVFPLFARIKRTSNCLLAACVYAWRVTSTLADGHAAI